MTLTKNIAVENHTWKGKEREGKGREGKGREREWVG